jgi:hypothetical protein
VHDVRQTGGLMGSTPHRDWQRPNLLGFRVMIDSQMLDQGGEYGPTLRQIESEGWVRYHLSDTAVVESLNTTDETRREELVELAGRRAVSMGTFVIDQSHIDMAFIGTDGDVARLYALHDLIWPSSWEVDAVRVAVGSKKAGARIRDTMHVDTAIKYAFDAFITHDGGIIKAADRIAAAYLRPRVLSTAAALAWFAYEIGMHRSRWNAWDLVPPLPAWPDDLELARWTPAPPSGLLCASSAAVVHRISTPRPVVRVLEVVALQPPAIRPCGGIVVKPHVHDWPTALGARFRAHIQFWIAHELSMGSTGLGVGEGHTQPGAKADVMCRRSATESHRGQRRRGRRRPA